MAKKSTPKPTYEDPLIIYGRVPIDYVTIYRKLAKLTLNSEYGILNKRDLFTIVGLPRGMGKTVFPLSSDNKYELRKYDDRKLEKGDGGGEGGVFIEQRNESRISFGGSSLCWSKSAKCGI